VSAADERAIGNPTASSSLANTRSTLTLCPIFVHDQQGVASQLRSFSVLTIIALKAPQVCSSQEAAHKNEYAAHQCADQSIGETLRERGNSTERNPRAERAYENANRERQRCPPQLREKNAGI
jgi:hypothetical protein